MQTRSASLSLPVEQATSRAPRNASTAMVLRIVRHPLGAVGLVITCAVMLLALLAPQLAPYDPIHQFYGQELRPPSAQHLLGTDEFGRDILSRIIYGARVSLMVGLVAVLLGGLVGVTTGLLAGYGGGWVDALIMRLYDGLLAFPAILLGIAVATVLGPGAINAAIALAIVSVPQFARIARASMLTEKGKDYVAAARALGAADSRIVFTHVLPNSISPLIVQLTLAMAYAVLLEASLSFLGLGAQPPEPSWGSMLSASHHYLRQAPWYGVFPGIVLSLLLLGLNFLSDGVRDALNPRLINTS